MSRSRFMKVEVKGEILVRIPDNSGAALVKANDDAEAARKALLDHLDSAPEGVEIAGLRVSTPEMVTRQDG